jgi:hypothetical protein
MVLLDMVRVVFAVVLRSCVVIFCSYFFLNAQTHEKSTTKLSREGTKMSCAGLTLGTNNFWIHSKSSFTSPATCFECYGGTGTEMGRRRFQRWVGCNLGTLKKSSDFSSVNTFPPNSIV